MPRTKTYSAETGFVYQYHFEEDRDYPGGRVYRFVTSVSRQPPFVVEIRTPDAATSEWERTQNRTLTWTERYAIAKMALFAAMDTAASPQQLREPCEVDVSQISEIARTLDL